MGIRSKIAIAAGTYGRNHVAEAAKAAAAVAAARKSATEAAAAVAAARKTAAESAAKAAPKAAAKPAGAPVDTLDVRRAVVPAAAKAAAQRYPYVSASSVQAAKGQGIVNNPMWLNRYGAESHFGVVGSYSPIATGGPVGTNAWNVSEALGKPEAKAFNDFWAKKLGWETKGPPELTADGPLGTNAPRTRYDLLKYFGPDGAATMAGGPGVVVGVLGPGGDRGLTSAAGPLTRAFKRDAQGNFRNAANEIQRTIDVPTNGTAQKIPLTELYPAKTAKQMVDNDTSWAVDGAVRSQGGKDAFHFTSNEDQWVTALVIPTKPRMSFPEAMAEVNFSAPSGFSFGMRDITKNFDNFELELLDKQGGVLAKSTMDDMPNWVSMKVPKGTELQARVHLKNKVTGAEEEAPYRLIVTGSGAGYGVDYPGAHLINP